MCCKLYQCVFTHFVVVKHHELSPVVPGHLLLLLLSWLMLLLLVVVHGWRGREPIDVPVAEAVAAAGVSVGRAVR